MIGVGLAVRVLRVGVVRVGVVMICRALVRVWRIRRLGSGFDY